MIAEWSTDGWQFVQVDETHGVLNVPRFVSCKCVNDLADYRRDILECCVASA